MSCGNHHETNCSEALRDVWLYLDKECNEERRQRLIQHLDECNHCLSEYGIEDHLKQLLHRKCGGDEAPNDLKQRLREQICSKKQQQA
jgi:mycothiol system anti-sigma-R factor